LKARTLIIALVGLAATLVGSTSAAERPLCAVVVTGLAEKTFPEARTAVANRCLPVDPAGFAPLLAGVPSDRPEELAEARAAYRKARDLFVNVELDAATELAQRALNLFAVHHAELAATGSYRVISETHVFLGLVLLQKNLAEKAIAEFRSAIAIDPSFQPDPAIVPPKALKLFQKTARYFLASPRGALTLKVTPAGAEIVLDGKVQGEAPLTLKDLLPGRHYLVIRHEGYLPWEAALQIERAALGEKEIFLKPTPLRTLQELPDPAQAEELLTEIGKTSHTDWVVWVRGEPGQELEDSAVLVYRTRDAVLEPAVTVAAFVKPPVAPEPVQIGLAPQPPPVVKAPPPFIAPPPDAPPPQVQDRSVLRSWWFWTLVGGVAVAAGVTIPLLWPEKQGELHITILPPP
jgi:hypothetical protein